MCRGCGFRSMSIGRQKEFLKKGNTPKASTSNSRKKRNRHGGKTPSKTSRQKSWSSAVLKPFVAKLKGFFYF